MIRSTTAGFVRKATIFIAPLQRGADHIRQPFDGMRRTSSSTIRREDPAFPVFRIFPRWALAAAAVGREIRALKDQGIAEGDIAVVSLRGMMYPGNIMHAKELGGCGVAPATELGERGGAARERIVCDTFLRYKGLERPVVIVADVDAAVEKYAVRMNIAVSRALGALRVVLGRRELERDEVLRRVVGMGAAGTHTVN